MEHIEAEAGVPIVCMDFYNDTVGLDTVISNSFYGTYAPVSYTHLCTDNYFDEDTKKELLALQGNDIVCQSLGCLTNRINIHTVCSCADYPAQTTSTCLLYTSDQCTRDIE